ncbi:MAG: alpha/beta hydrolase family protein [bacterium]
MNYQSMVYDYYVERVRRLSEIRRKRLNSISTLPDALDYQKEVLEAINNAFSPKPEKTPLNPQVTGILQLQGYRIEKILFESRPGCIVSSNLYVPDDLDSPAPGVIGSCGHSENGKACDLYQEFCQRLVLSGFVVLIYDPFNQGERDQYITLSEREAVRSCCPAHNMMGKQLELIGEFFGMWRVWDGIRALDYLLTRPEVDPSRVGVTGNSGGGTLTTWLWAVEDRFTMAAPGCFVTTFLNNLENELPADCEQYPPGVIGAGLEMADFIIARAPKPVILLGQKYDYFDRRGLISAYEDAVNFYNIIGAPKENIAVSIGPQGHGYSIHNQEAMVDFFAYHAKQKVTKVTKTEILNEEELYAAPNGSVIAAGATPIYELIAKESDRISKERKPLDEKNLKEKLTELLNLPVKKSISHYRVLRPTRIEGKTFARYAIDTEDNIRVFMKKFMKRPEYSYSLDVEDSVHLYLPHLSSEDDIQNEPFVKNLMDSYELYLLDVRGLGESMPENKSNFLHPYGMDYMFHGHGILLGESYLGRRVFDVLCTIDVLMHEGAREIHLYGRGQGAIIALFTGVLNDNLASVTIKNAPESYELWINAPIVLWPSANFLRSVLKFFDLPDCVNLLGNKLRIIEPWGPDMKPVLR